MLEVIGTLISIAAALGLSRAMDHLDYLDAKQDEVTSDDVIKATQTMINEARSKGQRIVEKLADRLNAIDIPFAAGSAVRDFLRKERGNMKQVYDTAKDMVSEVEKNLTTQEARANNLAIQPDSVRWKMQDAVKNVIGDTQKSVDQINNLERSVKDA